MWSDLFKNNEHSRDGGPPSLEREMGVPPKACSYPVWQVLSLFHQQTKMFPQINLCRMKEMLHSQLITSFNESAKKCLFNGFFTTMNNTNIDLLR